MKQIDHFVCHSKMNKTIFLFGGGKLPKLILNELIKKKYKFFVIEIGKTNIPQKYIDIKNINLGKILTELILLKKQGYNKILMAGSITRPKLTDIKLDFNSIKLISKFTKEFLQGGDNRLLKFVIEQLEKIGFRVLQLNKLFPELFLGYGNQTKIKIKKNYFKDISKGCLILKSTSKFDIGQSIIIQQGHVIGIEAAQGTDNLIKQSFVYLKEIKEGILIKLVKVKQDFRADLPTIGFKTLINCKKNGFVGIAYSANKTIFIDKQKIINLCNSNKIFLYGIK